MIAWTFSGLFLDFSWTFSGLFLDFFWTFFGLFLDFSWTFFRKICAKVLVSEDYVLKKEQFFRIHKGSFLFIGEILFAFEILIFLMGGKRENGRTFKATNLWV